MSFGPTPVVALTAATATAGTLVPVSKAGARNEIPLSELLQAIATHATADPLVLVTSLKLPEDTKQLLFGEDLGLLRYGVGTLYVSNGEPATDVSDVMLKQLFLGGGTDIGIAKETSGQAKFIDGFGGLGGLIVRGDATMPFVVQQSGGTPGTDELQMYHDGSKANIISKDGGIDLGVAISQAVSVQDTTSGNAIVQIYPASGGISTVNILGGGAIYSRIIADVGFLTFTSCQYGWSSNGFTSNDTGLTRVAATVVGPTNGSSGAGWFQNTAGRARVTTDVTNATTTFANVTGAVFTAIAGRKYSGHVVVRCEDDVAAEGVKFDWNGGAATMAAFWSALGVIAGGGTRVLGADISTSLAGVMNYSTITGDTVFMIPFSCTADQAGTVQLRQAQNSHAAGTLTVKALSFVMTEDMPN